MEPLQARRSCASSLDTFTLSFLHRAWPKTCGLEIGSRSALIVVAHVFSWLVCATCEAVWEGEGPWLAHLRYVLQHVQTIGAFLARAVLAYLKGRGGDAVPRMAHNLCALRIECGGFCHCQRLWTSFRRLHVQDTSHNRKAKSGALLPDVPCPLHAKIFPTSTKDRSIPMSIPSGGGWTFHIIYRNVYVWYP